MTMGEGSITVVLPNATVNVRRSASDRTVNLSFPSGLATCTSCMWTRCDLRVLAGWDWACGLAEEKLAGANQSAADIVSTVRKRLLVLTTQRLSLCMVGAR